MSNIYDLNIIVASPYWAMNGVNIFSANLVRELQLMGVRSHIILTEQKSMKIKTKEPLLPLPPDLPIEYLPVDPKAGWAVRWMAMKKYLESQAPCIYLPNIDWRHSNVSSVLSKRVGIVGIVHSDDPLHYDHVARLGKYWDAIVTVSSAIERKVALLDRSLSARTVTIPIGVPISESFLEKRRENNAPLKIINHGIISRRQKRIFDLKKIAEELDKKHIPFRLNIAGDGPEKDELQAAMNPLIKKGLVNFLGVIPHNEILALLQDHHVFLLTSEFEGMPNSMLEAMGASCVPVVTDIESGIPELIVDDVNGFRVKVGDISQFADHISTLYYDPEKLMEMSAAAYNTVVEGKYISKVMAEKYLNLFSQIARKSQSVFYLRSKGRLAAPPQEVDNISILPLRYSNNQVRKFNLLLLRDKHPFIYNLYRIISRILVAD